MIPHISIVFTEVIIAIKGINTPSVKRQRQRQWQWQGPIGMHFDAPKSVPDQFPSVNPSIKTSKLPLPLTFGVGTPYPSAEGLLFASLNSWPYIV